MAELVRTNDPGVISVIEGLLSGANIPYRQTAEIRADELDH